MKTKFIILFFLIIPLFAIGQMNSSIDFVFGIENSYRSLKYSSHESIPIDIISQRNDAEEGKNNWRIGFNYNKRLANKFYLKSGIRLASVGYKGGVKDDLRWPSEIGPNGYMPDPSLPKQIQQIYDYRFLEIPIIGRYEFSNKRFTPFIELGISPSYYLTTRITSITDLGTSTISKRGGVSTNKNLHFVSVASIGGNYLINNSIQVFGQLAYRYHLTNLYDAPVTKHLYNYGLEIGVRKRIN